MNEEQIAELKSLVDELTTQGLSKEQIQASVDQRKAEFANAVEVTDEIHSCDGRIPLVSRQAQIHQRAAVGCNQCLGSGAGHRAGGEMRWNSSRSTAPGGSHQACSRRP